MMIHCRMCKVKQKDIKTTWHRSKRCGMRIQKITALQQEQKKQAEECLHSASW